MRVGLYCESLLPEDGGGFSFLEQLLGAALGFAMGRHELVLFAARSGPARELAERKGIEFVPIPSEGSRKVRHFLWSSLPVVRGAAQAVGYRDSLTRRALAARVDVMWFLGRAVAPVDVPYVCTILDLQHREQPWWPEVSSRGRWAFREDLIREAVSRAALVIVPNEVSMDQLSGYYGVPSARMLALPHPTPAFPSPGTLAIPSALESLLGARKFVLYPAQFWPHKNHTAIVRALRHLDDVQGVHLDAVFCGADKGNLAHVRNFAQGLGLADRVHFPGFVDRDVLAALYRRAFCLAYPSFFGPENLPPLEAFALGCPVIAADVPGARLQLGDAAILVDPASAENWAAAFSSLSDPGTRARFADAGRKRSEGWTSDAYVRAVVKWLDSFQAIRECW